MKELADSGVAPEEIAARAYSGEFVDLNEVYGRHPELIIPFLVAGELRVYDEEYTAAEKRAFPEEQFRRFARELFRRAIAMGLLDLNAPAPTDIYRDPEAFDALAAELVPEYRC